MNIPLANSNRLFWALLAIANILIWLPVTYSVFPTVGLGFDSQVFTNAVHASLRENNGIFSMSPKLLAAREDIFSYPYFGVMYPFYGTWGLGHSFDFDSNLRLDFYSIVFHMTLASCTFALLLKRMGSGVVVSVIFGVLYAYSLHLKMWSSWIWALSGYAWLPLCLLGVWETVVKNSYRAGFLYFSVGFGMMFLGTALPIVYAAVLSLVFFLYCLAHEKPSWLKIRNSTLVIFLAACVALLLGGSHLLPIIDQSPDYIRWYSGGAIEGSFKPPYEGTLDTVLEFSLKGLSQFLLPLNWYGVGHPYVGGTALMLFAYYIYLNFNKLAIYPFLFCAVYFLFDSFGDATAIHRVTYQIPLLGSVRYPLANIFITNTIILLLASLGLKELINSDASKSKTVWMVLVVLVSVASAILLYAKQAELIRGFRELPSWVLLLPVIASIVFAVFLRKRMSKLGLILILASVLPLNTMLVHPKVPQANSLYMQCDDFREIEENLRSIRKSIDGPVRLSVYHTINFKKDTTSCLSRLKLSPQLLSSVAMVAGWGVMQMYLSPRSAIEFRLFNRLSSKPRLRDRAAVLRAGISHVLFPKDFKPDPEIADIYSFTGFVGDYPLYEVNSYQLGLSALGCLDVNSNRDVDLVTNQGRRRLQMNPTQAKSLDADCVPKQDSVAELKLKGIRGSTIEYTVRSDSSKKSIMITDQVFSDSWNVTLNGKKATTLKVDEYRLGYIIPQGVESIRMSYSPMSFSVGVLLSWLGFVIVLMVFFIPMIRRLLEKVRVAT